MEIIGHENTLKQIDTAIMSAKKRNKAIPHVLLSGAAGCGKTTLANVIAKKSDADFLSVVPNDLNNYDSVVSIFEKFSHKNYDAYGNRTGVIKPTVVFMDEIHNLPLKGQELFGLAMERFIIETGEPNKYYWIPYFTLVGATTLSGKLSKPFRDRFKLLFDIQPYAYADMVKIVNFHIKDKSLFATQMAIQEIAKRSKGTPRIAVGYVERMRDGALAEGSELITKSLVNTLFNEMGVDEMGFTKIEMRILQALHDAKSPLSLDNLSIMLQEDSKSIKDYAEPYLIRENMIMVSGKGRILTQKGKEYISTKGKLAKLEKREINFDYVRK